ncbi:hypothetical protein [Parashewanella tropica]|uniref:hypothetical protein n=1 Tax=Parashewanella tropica TaxID=2547970 RepID=UPI0010596FA8|nr:hypothetical protein [Parashewanella tropica]
MSASPTSTACPSCVSVQELTERQYDISANPRHQTLIEFADIHSKSSAQKLKARLAHLSLASTRGEAHNAIVQLLWSLPYNRKFRYFRLYEVRVKGDPRIRIRVAFQQNPVVKPQTIRKFWLRDLFVGAKPNEPYKSPFKRYDKKHSLPSSSYFASPPRLTTNHLVLGTRNTISK